MCMYLCIYVYIHICACVYVCTYTCNFMWTEKVVVMNIELYMYTCIKKQKEGMSLSEGRDTWEDCIEEKL